MLPDREATRAKELQELVRIVLAACFKFVVQYHDLRNFGCLCTMVFHSIAYVATVRNVLRDELGDGAAPEEVARRELSVQ